MIFFNEQQLRTILTLQAKANSAMSDAWLTSDNISVLNDVVVSDIPYYRACWMEASEAVGHLGFKWWKKETPNMEQAILELVDILHFAASEEMRTAYKMIQEFNGEKGVDTSISIEEVIEFSVTEFMQYDVEGEEYTETPTTEDLRQYLEHFAHSCLDDCEVSLNEAIELFMLFGCDSSKIYNMYVGKNILNLFRTKHGQRENKYIKIWEGKEDNHYLEQYFSDLNGAAVNVEDLNNHLETMYSHVVKFSEQN